MRFSCFNSRAPRGARRLSGALNLRVDLFQFTCPSRSTTSCLEVGQHLVDVSIHVPLAEHDRMTSDAVSRTISFNSRAPRGARLDRVCGMQFPSCVSIHVPLAEHDAFDFSSLIALPVSIHVPLAEHD